jgi:cell division protein FtsB
MPGEKPSILRRIIQFRYLFVVNGAVLVLLGFAYAREQVRDREIGAMISQLQDKAATLEARDLEISQLGDTLQTESALEREARLKLGMKKPGETEVVVERGADAALAPAADPNAGDPSAPIANPRKWWLYFFDQEKYRQLADYGK